MIHFNEGTERTLVLAVQFKIPTLIKACLETELQYGWRGDPYQARDEYEKRLMGVCMYLGAHMEEALCWIRGDGDANYETFAACVSEQLKERWLSEYE